MSKTRTGGLTPSRPKRPRRITVWVTVTGGEHRTAERIAKSLTLSLFYNPALDDPAKKAG